MKITGFRATAAIKQHRTLAIMVNPKMVCSCRSSCIDLPVSLFGFQMEGCASCLHHVCQVEYVAMHDIDIDGAERKICHGCVDKIQMVGKPEKLNKVQHSTVYRME